jgi:hypothetical protein
MFVDLFGSMTKRELPEPFESGMVETRPRVGSVDLLKGPMTRNYTLAGLPDTAALAMQASGPANATLPAFKIFASESAGEPTTFKGIMFGA